MQIQYKFRITVVLIFLGCSTLCYGQQTARMTQGGTGYLEHLPPDYQTNTAKQYPVLFFLHGTGETGYGTATDLNKVKVNGPPKLIEQGHNMCFTINGVEECFIVISPQLKPGLGGWWPGYLQEIFDYILNGNRNYRIDKNRVYLTGLSLGGQGVYIGAGETQDIFAAAAPIAGFNNGNGCTISARKIPFWGFHGMDDSTIPYATGLTEFSRIGWCTTPSPTAELKWTPYAGVGHNAWDKAYSPDHSIQNPNLYEWLLSKSKGPVNKTPLVNAGSDQTITLPTNVLTLSGSGTDPHGTIISYQWSKVSGPTATLNSSNTSSLNLSNLAAGIYNFRLTVTDNGGATASDDVIVTVNPLNVPPVVNAGSDQTIILPSNSISLTGSAIDSDGTIASYQWSKVSGATATLNNTNTSTLSITNLSVGTYIFRLTATDNLSTTAFDEVTIIVKVANQPPTANAGSDKTITLPTNSVLLTGIGSDPDGTISYAWSQQSGTLASLSSTITSNVTISDLTQGVYIFRLTVTDNGGLSNYDDVVVTVRKAAETNLALNQPTIASSIEYTGLGTELAVDGNTSTRWSSKFSDLQWIYVDLGSEYSISHVKIQWENALASDYQLQVSYDAINWKTIITISGNTQLLNDITNLNDSGRYVRIYSTKRGTTYGYSIFELEVYGQSVNSPNFAPIINAGPDINIYLPSSTLLISGSAIDSDGIIISYHWAQVSGPVASLMGTSTPTLSLSALTEGTYNFSLTALDNDGLATIDYVTVFVNKELVTNLALKKPVTASSFEYSALAASFAVDGNSTTRWSSQFSDPQWIYVDLGTDYFINRVKVYWEKALAADYQVQFSSDAISWKTIKAISDNVTMLHDFTDLNEIGRYVRIYCTKRGSPFGYSIYELEVYGQSPGDRTFTGGRIMIAPVETKTPVPSISIYPIPFENHLIINGAPIGSWYLIRNTSGVVLLEGILSEEHINTSELSQGLYVMDLIINNEVIRKKLVK